MKRLHFYLSSLLMAGLMGCSTALVKSDFDRDVDFAVYKTFAWAESVTTVDSNSVVINSLLDKRIKRAVEKELASGGIYKESSDTPDLQLAYTVSYKDQIEVTNYGYDYYPSYYGYGYGAGFYRFGLRSRFFGYGYWPGYYGLGYGYGASYYGGIEARQYTEVKITIDIIDPATKELLWRGWYIDETDDENLDEKQINEAVRKILAKYPPEQLKNAHAKNPT